MELERPLVGRRGILAGTAATLMAGALAACSAGEAKEAAASGGNNGGGGGDLDVIVIGAGAIVPMSRRAYVQWTRDVYVQQVKARWDPTDVFRHALSVRLPE